jgi:hypothetical protein
MTHYNAKLNWLKSFQASSKFGNMTFKCLDVNYPLFEKKDEFFTKVDLATFNKIEEDRIPFFIGSRFGIYPNINKLEGFFNGRKQVALLAKSLLSEFVYGLIIYGELKGEKVFIFRKSQSLREYC